MTGEIIVSYWPQVTALIVVVFWISRTIQELKGENAKQNERLRQADLKITALWDQHNRAIERMLNDRKN